MQVLDAIHMRRSVREYDTAAIPNDVMDRMKEALRYAPSACNNQPWKFVLVSRPGLRADLARAANGQTWMAAAPVTIVGVALPDKAYKKMGGYGNSADVDVAIALDHLTLAATAEGLGTCWIGAFDEDKVKALLNIPASAKVVALTPLGYPTHPELIHPVNEGKRKPDEDVFCSETFS